MTKDKYIEQIFPIECRGRDKNGKEALIDPIRIKVKIHQSPGDEKNIHITAECLHNTGGHGERCKVSHPHLDKVGEGIRCPYSLDIPYTLDQHILTILAVKKVVS